MNIQALLRNKQIGLRTGTGVLKYAISKSILVNIESRTRLLDKKEEASKKRIRTLANIQNNLLQQRRTDRLVDNIASGAGLLSLGIGGGRRGNITPRNNIVSTRGLRTKPGRFSGLSRFKNIKGISRGNVILNTAFAGLDFKNRKSIGQTNTQALLGSGGGAVGGIAGAAIGQSLIPIPVIGALIGGFIGANIGSGVADRASGVTSAEFRRREEEKQVNLRENARTEFTDGLDRFDSALNKFGRYNEETELFILKATGRDKDGNLIRLPRVGGGGGVGQAFVNEAYGRGVGVGAGGVAAAILGTVLAIKAGKFLLSAATFAKLRSLAAFVMRGGKKKIDVQILDDSIINKIIKKPIKQPIKIKPKVTRGGIKPGKKKILRGQDKVTSSDKVDLSKTKDLFKPKPNEKIILEKIIKRINKTGGIGQGDSVPITKPIKKLRIIQKELFRKNKKFDATNKSDLRSNANINNDGNNIAYIRMENSYLDTINNIHAFNQMTV